jgi:putative chitinase
MPNLKSGLCHQYFPYLTSAMEEFEINAKLRQAAFLAQIAHESGEFQYMRELWGPTEAQKRYEPPSEKALELGNIYPGDGKRFMGRGAIQLTGRDNYRKYGIFLRVDLENHPDMAADPDLCFRIAAAFWKKNGLNELADKGEFKMITWRINGGLSHYDKRLGYFNKAKLLL